MKVVFTIVANLTNKNYQPNGEKHLCIEKDDTTIDLNHKEFCELLDVINQKKHKEYLVQNNNSGNEMIICSNYEIFSKNKKPKIRKKIAPPTKIHKPKKGPGSYTRKNNTKNQND